MTSLSSLSAGDFLKKASSVATHYGFMPFESLTAERGEKKILPADLPPVPETVKRDPLGSLAAALIERAVCANLAGARRKAPRLVYHIATPRGGGKGSRKSVKFGIAVLGCSKSIGEALIIKASLAILEEVGVKNATVYLNSLGDRDSMTRYARELGAHLRRHLHELPPECQQAMKRDPFEALENVLEQSLSVRDTLPRPLHFLSEVSRRHLREVLEFLEVDKISYSIEDQLMGPRDCYTQTLFEIRHPGEAENTYRTIVRGGRLDELAKKNFKANLPVVGAVFEYEQQGAAAKVAGALRSRHPKFFLVQLGFNAKLLSLSVLESLRKARIPVSQAIDNDSLRDQLEYARNLKAPYLIIMGQREVIDRTVIVRNVNSQAQEIVPIHVLSNYLKGTLRI